MEKQQRELSEVFFDDSTDEGSLESWSSFFNLCDNDQSKSSDIRLHVAHELGAINRDMGPTPSNKSSASSIKYMFPQEHDRCNFIYSDKETEDADELEPLPHDFMQEELDRSKTENTLLNRRLTLSNLDITFNEKKGKKLIKRSKKTHLPPKQENGEHVPRPPPRRNVTSEPRVRKASDFSLFQDRRLLKGFPQSPEACDASMDITGKPISLLTRLSCVRQDILPNPPTFNVISPSPTPSIATSRHDVQEYLLQKAKLQTPIESLSGNSSSSGTLSPASMISTLDIHSVSSASSGSSDCSGILPPLQRTPGPRRRNLLPPLNCGSIPTPILRSGNHDTHWSSSPSSPTLKDIPSTLSSLDMKSSSSPPVSVGMGSPLLLPRHRFAANVDSDTSIDPPKLRSGKKATTSRRRKKAATGATCAFHDTKSHTKRLESVSSSELDPFTPDSKVYSGSPKSKDIQCRGLDESEVERSTSNVRKKSFLPEISQLDSLQASPDTEPKSLPSWLLPKEKEREKRDHDRSASLPEKTHSDRLSSRKSRAKPFSSVDSHGDVQFYTPRTGH